MNKNSEKANRYKKNNTKQYNVVLNLKTDKLLIEHMDKQPNKQGYIKRLIKDDMMMTLFEEHELKSLK